MKYHIIHYIYLLLILTNTFNAFSQDINLEISSEKDSEKLILSKIDYKKVHKDSVSVYNEIQKISSYLKNRGYFTNTFNTLKVKNNTYKVFFSLKNKIKNAYLLIESKFKNLFSRFSIKNDSVLIPIEDLESTLIRITKKLDDDGKSFSRIKLKSIVIKNKNLYASVNIYQSKRRIINKVIIKGYEAFPKSFLKNYFKINKRTLFNQKKIREISDLSKNLQFAKEIKPPEVLFTKDSTLLYMYFKKHQNNSFDGIINFASKEDGGVLFNGNIDLKLNNVLNTGEKFNVFWNSIEKERQEFKLSTEIPYIFNSKFSPEISFSIYKQDSTFLNTTFNAKLFYNINSKIKLALTYNSEASENLDEMISNNIESYNNYFLGFQFQYKISKNDFFSNDKFKLSLNPSFGKRSLEFKASNQFKIEASASYLWDINLRNSIYLKNTTGHINSDSFIDNELFRIGGANSIRGFNEQSIFTNSYTYFNIEYRLLTSRKSFFYTITDIGRVKTIKDSKNLLGIGLGYLFTTNKSQINISSVIGKSANQSFNFKDSKLIISWKNYF